MRTTVTDSNGLPTSLVDAYLNHHPRDDSLRCLALWASGAADEGERTMVNDTALRINLRRNEGDTVQERTESIEIEKDGEASQAP